MKKMERIHLVLQAMRMHHQPVPNSVSITTTAVVSSYNPLERLNHKDWLTPNEVLQIFEPLRDPETVLQMFDKFSKRKDYKPTEALYTLIIQKLSRGKKFDAIQDIMTRLKTEKSCNLSDDFFYLVIKTYGNVAGRIDGAIQLLFSMPEYNCWPTIRTFNFVLNMLVSTKQFEIIHEVYLGASRLGLEIDTCCLNILIKGLCQCDKLNAAFELLDEFPKLNCKPNVRTYSTLMHRLCKHGRVDEAFKLLERMEHEGCDPDAITFNTLISGLSKKGRVSEGVQLLEKMKFKGCDPDPGSYHAILTGLLDCKKFVEAKCFMDRMISLGVLPSFVSYKLLLHGLCDEKLLEDVDFVLKKMFRQGFVPRMGMWKKILQTMFAERPVIQAFSDAEISQLTRSL